MFYGYVKCSEHAVNYKFVAPLHFMLSSVSSDLFCRDTVLYFVNHIRRIVEPD